MALVASAWCAFDVPLVCRSRRAAISSAVRPKYGWKSAVTRLGQRGEVGVVVVRRQDRLGPADARQDVLLHERRLEGEGPPRGGALGALLGGLQVSGLAAVERSVAVAREDALDEPPVLLEDGHALVRDGPSADALHHAVQRADGLVVVLVEHEQDVAVLLQEGRRLPLLRQDARVVDHGQRDALLGHELLALADALERRRLELEPGQREVGGALARGRQTEVEGLKVAAEAALARAGLQALVLLEGLAQRAPDEPLGVALDRLGVARVVLVRKCGERQAVLRHQGPLG